MTDNKELFAKEHDKLFADLEALNEQQIEVGLAAGVWNEQDRSLVQYYLYDLAQASGSGCCARWAESLANLLNHSRFVMFPKRRSPAG